MSHVEEALRRAREAAATEGRLEVDHPLLGDDVEVAEDARDPFPIEMPDRHAPHPPGGTTPPSAARTSAATGARPHSEPHVHQAAAAAEKSAATSPLLERIDQQLSEKLIIDRNMMGSSREQYRRLAAALHHMHLDGLSVVMIASAVPGEGKTLTASNLAMTFSESYQRSVLLIDADLRRPMLHQLFRLPNIGGLSDGLGAPDDRKLQVRQLSPRLCVLPAGRPTSDPMAELTSPRMKRVIQEAKEAFNWVIIDTPPVGLLPDANLLGAMVDGTVLVIRAGTTPYHLVKRAVELIGRHKIVGTVLNRAEPGAFTAHNGYYEGRYYTSGQRGS